MISPADTTRSEPTLAPVPRWRPRARVRHGWVPLVVLALLLVAALGWLLGGAVRFPKATVAAPPPSRTLSVGGLQVAVDGSWRPAPVSATVPRDLHRVRTFAPVPGAPVTAWIAPTRIADPSLVPARIHEALARPLPAPVRTSVARREAWAYRGLQLRNGASLVLTVLPTTAGSLMVGCSAPSAWSSAASGCAGQVLDVGGGAPLHPSRRLAFRRGLPAVVARLNHGRRAGRRAFHAARTPRRQARVARSLQRVHARAADRLAAIAPSARTAPIPALRNVSAAYARLAKAARAPQRYRRGRYGRARQRVGRADVKLRRALRRAG